MTNETDLIWLVMALITGAAIGAAIALARARAHRASLCREHEGRLQAIGAQLARRDAELIGARERADRILGDQVESDRARALAEQALQAAREDSTARQGSIERLEGELARVREQVWTAQAERDRIREAAERDREHAEEKLRLLTEAREQMKRDFELLAQQVLDARQQQMNEQQQQMQIQGRESLEQLLRPFREQIQQFRDRVDTIHTHDTSDRASLRAEIVNLQKLNQAITEEARHLAEALRGNKKTQGNWGEMILETVLERSGLRKGIEFEREVSIQGEDGRYRPDARINLPDDKHLIIDAKVSLADYSRYANADDDAERQRAAAAHLLATRRHMQQLSERAYENLPGLNTPEMVFMFMPVEPAFTLALEQDANLVSDAFERRVAIVTPTTLLATLRTVASLWKLEMQNRNARKIADQAGKLHDKFVIFLDHMEKVGTALSRAQEAHEAATKSLATGRGNLVSSVDKLRRLGAPARKNIKGETLSLARDTDTDTDLDMNDIDETPGDGEGDAR
ncbi:MAG: DNA recombination protein RmuC [Halothiobacillaceae bacterium]